MPIYEYKCRDCGDRFEKLIRSGSDADKADLSCPVCQSAKVERLISRCGFIGGSGGDFAVSESSSSSCAPSGG